MTGTSEVLRSHHKALLGRDADALVSLYAPDAVILSAGGVIRGLDGIRAAFLQLPPGFAQVEYESETEAGEYHLKVWRHPVTGVTGSDVFRVVDGKIVFQSVVTKPPAS